MQQNAVFIVAGLVVYFVYGYFAAQVLERCGRNAWWGYVPVLNLIALTQAAGLSAWWVLTVPITAPILHIVVWMNIGRRLNRGLGFSLGLVFLPVLFLPILIWRPQSSDINI